MLDRATRRVAVETREEEDPMAIERSRRPVAVARMTSMAYALLDAAPLCAIATAKPNGDPHVNTAYFAWNSTFEVVWLSEPRARHSRNLRSNEAATIAVYDSSQPWDRPGRGIQLFGTAGEIDGTDRERYEWLYAERFPAYSPGSLRAYRLYRFRAHSVKLLDEPVLGGGVFVVARVGRGRRLVWERTELYRSDT
jgi:uncharacterized protein YhbP (UPF0306 family)